MPIDWGKIINIGTQAVIPVVGAIAGNKAAGAGIERSGENLGKAYDVAGRAYTGSLQAAQPYYRYGLDQGNANLDWAGRGMEDVAGRQFEGQTAARDYGYNQANSLANWGYGQSQQARQSLMNQSLQALQSGYGRSSANLSPYANSGVNALNELNKLTFGSRSNFQPQQPQMQGSYAGPDGNWRQAPIMSSGPPQMQTPPWAQGSLMASQNARPFAPMQPLPSSQMGSGSAGGPPSASMGGGGYGGGMVGEGGPGGLNLGDNQVGKPGAFGGVAGSLLSNFGGAAMSGLLGSGLGMGAGAALGGLAGPIGMAVGAMVGPLVGRLTRAGREREGASTAVNEFSTWGKGIMEQARSGQIDPGTARQALEQGFGEYVNWVNANIKDDDVREGSISSQRKYFEEGFLKDIAALPQTGGAAPPSGSLMNANPNWWQMGA